MGLKSYLPQATEQKGLKSYLPATQKATTTPREVLGQYGYEAPKQSGWSLLGKGFMNTLGGVLEVLRTGEYAVGGLLAGKGPITGIKEKISPSTTLLGEKKEEDKLWSQRGIAALAIDILLDPTTYLTFGAGGATKLSTKGGQVLLNKSGQKLMKTMVGKGVSEAAARRTMARVIQEGGEAAATKYIGKSGLKFMGKVFIPAEQFQKAGKVLGKLPGAGTVNKVGSGFSKAFVPFREIDKMPVKIGGKGTYTDFLYKPYVRETRDKIFKEIDTVKVAAAKAYKEYGIDIGKEIGQRVEKGTKAVSKLDPLAEQASKFKSADEFINSQTLFRGQKPEFKELQKVAQSNAVDNLLIGRGVFTTTNESIAKTYGSNVFKFQKPAGKIFDLTNASEKELRKFLPESFFKERRLGGLIHRPDDTFTSSYKTYKELIKEGDIKGAEEILFEGMADKHLPIDVTWEEVKAGFTAISGTGKTADVVRDKILKELTDNGFDWMKHQGGIRLGKKEHDVFIALKDEALKPLNTKQLTDVFNKAKTAGGKTGTKVEETFLDEIVTWMGKEQKEMLAVEKATGKKIGEIKGYLRHYLTPEGRDFIAKGGDFSAMSKPLRAKLGAATGRKLVRVVSETGKDVTWDKARHALKPFKDAKVIDQLENVAQKKIKALQSLQEALAKGDVDKIMKLHREYNDVLKTHISKFPEVQSIIKGVEKFNQKEFDDIVSGIASLEAKELAPVIKELEGLVKTSQGREFLSKPLRETVRVPYQAKVIAVQKKILGIQKELTEKIKKYQFFDYVDAKGSFYKTVSAGEEFKGALSLTIKEINSVMKAKHGIKNFFEPDAFKAFAMRKAEHVKFINTNKFLEATKARFGTRLDKAKTTVVDGIKLVESTNPQLKGWLLPEPIVKHLDDTFKTLTNEESLKGFVGVYDKMLGFWKKNVTGVWPSFHTRNAIGGTFNNWLAGVKLQDNLLNERILRGSDEIMKSKFGTEYSGKQIVDLMERFGVRGQPGMMDVYRQVDDSIKSITSSKLKKAGIATSNAPRWAMEQVEDRLRGPLFINRLRRGDTPAEAAKAVFKFHFDYLPETGLTPFERNVMRRVMPFYVWTRNNVPLQIEQMMKQPGKYANLEKLRQSMFDKGEMEDFKNLPDWMQETFTAPLPWKDEVGRTLWAQLDLPLEDINKLPISSSGIREIASLLTPFLKFPMERYFNKNMYFGGEIWNPDLPKEMQTRKTTDALRFLPNPIKKFINYREVSYRDWSNKEEKTFIKRYEIDAKKLHTVMSFLGRYYSTLSGVAEEDVPTQWKVSKYVGGVPVRVFDIPGEEEKKVSEQEAQVQEMMNYLKRHNIIPYKENESKAKSGLKGYMK